MLTAVGSLLLPCWRCFVVVAVLVVVVVGTLLSVKFVRTPVFHEYLRSSVQSELSARLAFVFVFGRREQFLNREWKPFILQLRQALKECAEKTRKVGAGVWHCVALSVL